MNLFGDLSFAQPMVLWVLAALHLLIALFLAGEKNRSVMLNRFLAPRLQDRLASSVSPAKRRWSFFFALAGLTLAIVAMAQPRWGFRWEERTEKGRDIIIAIDTSRSMLAQDLKPNRMSRAKLAAQDLLQQLAGDRVGLVAFAGTAFLQAPLTADYDAIRTSLTELDTEIIPRGGTNLTAAIETATDAFGKGESEHRALIIFTDGEELEADAVAAALAAASKFRIFTVGLGSAEGSLIPFTTERGGTDFVRDDKGQYVTTRLDEGRLREIAEAGNGFYAHLQNGPIEMQQIVREGLGKMKESQSDSQFSKQPIERYQWPLGGAVLCFIASLLIGDRRRLRNAATAAAASLLFLASTPAHAVPEVAFNQGCDAYQKGDYNTAAKAFSDALGSGPASLQPQAAYNLANTLARRGAKLEKKEDKLSEWKNSLQHYDRALALAPNYADAQHNREILRKAIEELEKPEQEQEQDEQKKDDQQKKDDEKKENEKKDEGKQDDQNKSQQDQKGDSQEKDKGEKKEQEKKDEQSGGGKGEQQEKDQRQTKEDQSKGEQGQPKPEEKNGEQPKPGEQKSPEERKPGEKKEGAKPEPVEQEPPKEGDLKTANPQPGQQEEGDPEKEADEAAAAAAEGRMTPKDAKLLLEAMKKFDERVRLLDPRENIRDLPRRGFKNW